VIITEAGRYNFNSLKSALSRSRRDSVYLRHVVQATTQSVQCMPAVYHFILLASHGSYVTSLSSVYQGYYYYNSVTLSLSQSVSCHVNDRGGLMQVKVARGHLTSISAVVLVVEVATGL